MRRHCQFTVKRSEVPPKCAVMSVTTSTAASASAAATTAATTAATAAATAAATPVPPKASTATVGHDQKA